MRSPPVLVVKPPPCRQQQEAVCHAESPRSMQVALCNLCTAQDFLVQGRKGDLVSAGATCWLPAREGILFLGVRRLGMKQNVQLYCVNEFCFPFRDFFFFSLSDCINTESFSFVFVLAGRPCCSRWTCCYAGLLWAWFGLGGEMATPQPKAFPLCWGWQGISTSQSQGNARVPCCWRGR